MTLTRHDLTRGCGCEQNGAQKSWEELALKHEDTMDELVQAKHELELAKTQLAESKEYLIAEKVHDTRDTHDTRHTRHTLT